MSVTSETEDQLGVIYYVLTEHILIQGIVLGMMRREITVLGQEMMANSGSGKWYNSLGGCGRWSNWIITSNSFIPTIYYIAIPLLWLHCGYHVLPTPQLWACPRVLLQSTANVVTRSLKYDWLALLSFWHHCVVIRGAVAASQPKNEHTWRRPHPILQPAAGQEQANSAKHQLTCSFMGEKNKYSLFINLLRFLRLSDTQHCGGNSSFLWEQKNTSCWWIGRNEGKRH